MPDIRSKKKSQTARMVDTLTFKVSQDPLYTGFNVKLSWDYDLNSNNRVVGFKIYKTVLKQPRLQQNYVITQRTLERTSATKGMASMSNILYNKSLFSQNSQVKFDQSNSDKHDKQEGNISEYSYANISFVRSSFFPREPEKNVKTYSFIDKNVKFGETYSYYITAFTMDLYETQPCPIYVNLEFFEPPKPPSYLTVKEVDRGLLLIFGNNQDPTVSKFIVWKREDSEKDFQILTEVDNDSENLYFTDLDILPKKNYIYRIFSQDIYGNISLSSAEAIGVFRFVPYFANIEYQPSIFIENEGDDYFKIRIRNERPDKVKSVRIERRDDWKFERHFCIKTFNGEPWNNNIFFDETNEITFFDKTTSKDRAYSYRITSFNLAGFPISFYVSPPVNTANKCGVNNIQLPINVRPKLIKFDVGVVNDKQSPIFVKCSWDIIGDWSYLIINKNQEKIKVDNIHKSAFVGNFIKNNTYDMSVEVFDLGGRLVDVYQNIRLTI